MRALDMRMTERNRPTILVDVLRVPGNAKFAEHGDALGGKGFVEFDDIEIGSRDAKPCRALAAFSNGA